MTTKLGTQTHRPTQADVFARHVAQRVKRRRSHTDMWIPHGVDEADPQGAADGDIGGDEVDGAVEGTKKRRGGGGAWRAHISKKLRSGESDWQSISASFGSRTEEEKVADLEAGRIGSGRHKAGLPAFGPKKVDEARARIANEAALFNRLQGIGQANFLAVTDTPVEPSLRECSADNFQHLMKVVRKADFLLSSERKKVEQELIEAARLFANTTGKDMRSRIVRDIPSLSAIEQKLYAGPSDPHGLACCERLHVRPNPDEISAQAIAMDTEEGNEKSKKRNLGVGLDAYWTARMRPIAPEEWTGPADKKMPESRCFLAGHCLCSPGGRQLHRFRNSLIRHQKLMTMKGTPERQLMQDGCLVWVLRGTPRDPLFAGMAGADDDSSGGVDEDVYLFWHIAMVLLSPYVPVYHVLGCDSADSGEKPAPHTEIAVKVTLCVFVSY